MESTKKETVEVQANQTGNGCIGNWKHMLLMVIGCLIPVGASLALTQTGYTGIASYLLFLLCPIMHFIMMRNMNKDQKKCH